MHHLPRWVGIPVLGRLRVLHEARAEKRDALQTVASGYLEKLGKDLLVFVFVIFVIFLCLFFFVPLFLLKHWYHLSWPQV